MITSIKGNDITALKKRELNQLIRPDLLKSIKAICKNYGNRSAFAKEAGIHKNTLLLIRKSKKTTATTIKKLEAAVIVFQQS